MDHFVPSRAEFDRLADEGATVIPVCGEVLSDALTPVVALNTLGQGAGSYLLESVVGGEKWARYSFVGCDPDLMVRGGGDTYERYENGERHVQRGVDPWESLRAELKEWRPPAVPWLPRFWGGAIGYISYDSVFRFEPTVGPLVQEPDRYDFSFAVGGTVLIFDNLRQTLRILVAARVDKAASLDAAYADAVQRIEEVRERLERPAVPSLLVPPADRHATSLPPSSFDESSFCKAVERAKEYIRAGDIFQVVLSQRFRVPAPNGAPLNVYRAMRALNPSPYMYFVRFPEVTIAGASPETLVRLEDGSVEVRPIAGTRRRGKTVEEDLRKEQDLRNDPKERAEHVMLVDLGRNDIGRISKYGSVRITAEMETERYSHVMHLASSVVGQLAPGRDALDVVRAVFPAGTLSGAPKVRAMQIIRELEPESRGIYGGAVGYIGFDGNMDLAIAIRTVLLRQGEYWLQAGAGIVEASDPAAEYRETLKKAAAGLLGVSAG